MCPETTVLKTIKHPDSLPKAESLTGDGWTSNLGHQGSHPLPQTMVLQVIGVHCPQHLQCHPGLTIQMDADALDKIGGIKKKHA